MRKRLGLLHFAGIDLKQRNREVFIFSTHKKIGVVELSRSAKALFRNIFVDVLLCYAPANKVEEAVAF